MTTVFYSVKKEKNVSNPLLSNAGKILDEINRITEELKNLNYDKNLIREVRTRLLQSKSELSLLYKNKYFHQDILGVIEPGNRPIFNLSTGFENLNELKFWFENKDELFILRVCGSVEEIVTFDDFVQEMLETPWQYFLLPKRYNKEEDTIWEYF